MVVYRDKKLVIIIAIGYLPHTDNSPKHVQTKQAFLSN